MLYIYKREHQQLHREFFITTNDIELKKYKKRYDEEQHRKASIALYVYRQLIMWSQVNEAHPTKP